jgi:hypothetical protein
MLVHMQQAQLPFWPALAGWHLPFLAIIGWQRLGAGLRALAYDAAFTTTNSTMFG